MRLIITLCLLAFIGHQLPAQTKNMQDRLASKEIRKEKHKLNKEEFKQRREALKAEIKAIQADPNLTDKEKETQIIAKRTAFRAERAKKLGLTDEQRKARGAEIRERLREIKDDPNLTEEEKSAQRQEYLQRKSAEYRQGGLRKGKMRSYNRRMEKIENNPNLSDGEKEQLKEQVERQKIAQKQRRKWATDRGEAMPRKYQKRELTDEEKKDILDRLERTEKKLKKDHKKGKITEEEFQKRLDEINQVRESVIR